MEENDRKSREIRKFEYLIWQIKETNRWKNLSFTYVNRDVAIYALGIGACGQDAVDSDELKFVYHRNGQDFIQVYVVDWSGSSCDVSMLFFFE